MHELADEPSGTGHLVPTLTLRSIWRRIRRDLVLLGSGNLAIVLAQLGFRGLLVDSLAPSAYGRLSLVLGIYNVIWIVGASGLPNAAARHIAKIVPADDSAIVSSAIRAAALPTLLAAAIVAGAAGSLLHSALAVPLSAVGLASLVYSLLMMGVLRGRGRMGAAAAVMPLAALGEVAPLALLRLLGVEFTPLLGFAVFCFGNAVGLITAVAFVLRTAPPRSPARLVPPTVRELLGFSAWLGLATLSLAMLPLALRTSAALDSYTTVAVVDVALVLFALPQRLGAMIVMAVTPHASRAGDSDGWQFSISARENALVMLPFAAIAAVVAFTPLIGWLFDLLGRPVYAKSAGYLALALLAGPARVLFGVIEGALIARGEGRTMAVTVLSVTAVAAGLIFAASALDSPAGAFLIFVLAYWAIYLLGSARLNRRALPSEAAARAYS
ncbi:MAG TPA: oligosaccharide flippase family protein [Solirubrobacteraceae bacterium]|jgi:O-antigen/teichoic acid export membrane protein